MKSTNKNNKFKLKELYKTKRLGSNKFGNPDKQETQAYKK